jgi:hypothetical protein
LATLGGLQYFLFRRMRRVFNPALLVTTLLVFVFLVWALIAFSAASSNLERAKKDAFDSIAVLERARADAYDANGDESRWLLDSSQPKQAKFYEDAFNQKSDRVAKTPTKTSDDALLTELKQTKKVPPDFKGFLADELRNITFPGEETAALETLRMFLVYRDIDGKIRKLEQDHQHAQAIALCVGTHEGESNWAFIKFDQALATTIKINKDYFTQYLERAKHDLFGLEFAGPLVMALAVAVLTFLGLRPRLKEYSFN